MTTLNFLESSDGSDSSSGDDTIEDVGRVDGIDDTSDDAPSDSGNLANQALLSEFAAEDEEQKGDEQYVPQDLKELWTNVIRKKLTEMLEQNQTQSAADELARYINQVQQRSTLLRAKLRQLGKGDDNAKKLEAEVRTTNGYELGARQLLSKIIEARLEGSSGSVVEAVQRTLRHSVESGAALAERNVGRAVYGESAATALHNIVSSTIIQLAFPMVVRSSIGVLLYGAPGNGKTSIARAVTAELHERLEAINGTSISLLTVASADIINSHLGDSEKAIQALFNVARESAPVVVFLDEVDALFPGLDQNTQHQALTRMRTEFQKGVDQLDQSGSYNVVFMAATNHRSRIDGAILRRFPDQYHIPSPTDDERTAYLLEKIRAYNHRTKETGVYLTTESRSIENAFGSAETGERFSYSDLSRIFTNAITASIRSQSRKASSKAASSSTSATEVVDAIAAMLEPHGEVWKVSITENAWKRAIATSKIGTRNAE